MQTKTLTLHLFVGQKIAVGENNDYATITKIEFMEKTGEVCLNTTKGPRKALTFRLTDLSNDDVTNPADRYR